LLLKTRVRNILKNQQRLTDRIRNEFFINPKEISISSPDEKFLSDLTQIVDKELSNSELGAEFISKELGMSHSVVYKKLKALTGFKIVEFVRDYRLTQAGKLLLEYGCSVSETAYKVGFSDRKYFSQIFKKKYFVTPTEYAKGQKET
jgi:AraC-like DNA-binding protein